MQISQTTGMNCDIAPAGLKMASIHRELELDTGDVQEDAIQGYVLEAKAFLRWYSRGRNGRDGVH